MAITNYNSLVAAAVSIATGMVPPERFMIGSLNLLLKGNTSFI